VAGRRRKRNTIIPGLFDHPQVEFALARNRRRRNSKRFPASTEVQTLLFDATRWTPTDAQAWALDHDFNAHKIDQPADYIRIRQRAPAEYEKDTFRTIEFGKFGDHGIKAVIGVPRQKTEAEKQAAGRAKAANQNPRRRNPARSGQFFVIVDVSVPGGKWVGLRGRKIYPHRDLADADREADILRGRVSSAVRKRHPHDAGIQVIDALWYGPAREVLRKQGITANPSRKNTGPSTRVWTLSVMPKFPGGSLELAALNTTTRAEVVGTANNFMNPSWRKRHGIPKYVEEKARELARERGETLFEPRRNPRERQRENPARRIGEDPAGRAPAVEEAMAKAEWALKDAEEAGRNAFALGDMAGVKKYARQIEKAQRDLSKLRTAQEMTGQRATWGSWRRGLREETDFRRRVGREAGEIIAGQRRGGRYTNPRRNAGRKRNAGGPIPRSNGYGPDPRGRGWTKRGNHWLWDNPTAGVTFMVLEKQGPGIPIYKLQALTDHGMYRHTKPAQWKTPQPAYAAAAEWFPALSGETVYSDLTQHWLRSNPSRHEVLTTTVPLDGRPLTSTERGRLRKLGFSVSEGAMVEQAGEKWYGHVYYPVRGGGWTSADIAVTTVP